MRLDAFDALMEDRADGEVALDGLERFFDGDELEMITAHRSAGSSSARLVRSR